jgi:hypothetical protein
VKGEGGREKGEGSARTDVVNNESNYGIAATIVADNDI